MSAGVPCQSVNKVLCLGQHLRAGSGFNHLVRMGTEAENLLIEPNFILSVIQLGNQTPREDDDGGSDVRWWRRGLSTLTVRKSVTD